ncbi:MAG: M43 family zinc metalloprotease, partial [Flavobacterium sp.]
VHNNRAYGVEENILDEQVFSQIEVLNQDFRRMLGTPGFNDHPDGADIEIEFCLAQRDLDGNPFNGINRVSLAPPFFGWSPTNIDSTLKPQTIWNPEKYFNIWVVRNISFFGIIQILGFAQFPQNSGLPGLAGGATTASTDGVVVAHRNFGSSVIFPGGTYQAGYDRGRTTTHEVGHWLGLRHIWGDTSECFDDGDFCNDTPPSTGQNTTCEPNFSCDAFNMIENYMDYTPDTCQNIFTQDQKTRMITVMNFASRRASLLNSDACIPPQAFAFDAGLSIVSTNVSDCEPIAAPQIQLLNEGSDIVITNAIISYNFSGNFPQSLQWNGNLQPGQAVFIELDQMTLPVGNHIFNVSIDSVNGEQDEFLMNNSRSLPVTINNAQAYTTAQVTLNLVLDNYPDETTWEFRNSSGSVLITGGPYTASGATITQTFDVEEDECYVFTIFDDFGDG